MVPQVASAYDIFKMDSHGVPVWVETATDLEAARLRTVELNTERPGEFVIFSHATQKLVSGAD